MKKIDTKTITQAALLVALLSASAYISIPLGFTPVTLTLQTMVCNIIAIMLGVKESFFTILVYVLIGFVGIPVFSGGVGGPAKLFGPTGGYILAFLVSVPLMSFLKNYFKRFFDKFIKNDSASAIAAYTVNAILIGMTVTYLLGTTYMKFLIDKTWAQAAMAAVVPFIPLDLAKCLAAALVAVPVKKALKK